jgi:hypothetical protein
LIKISSARGPRVVADSNPENQAALRQLLRDMFEMAVRDHARQHPADSGPDGADGGRR